MDNLEVVQGSIEDLIKDYIDTLNSQYKKLINGQYANVSTGEIFTQKELDKLTEEKLKIFKDNLITKTNEISDKPQINKGRKVTIKTKDREIFDGGKEFNILYRDNIKILINNESLNNTDLLVYFLLCTLIVFPSNSIIINQQIPTLRQLSKLLHMSDKPFGKSINKLKENNIIKTKVNNHRHEIFMNPKYCATGKDLNIVTLKMFGLLDYDEEKIKEYLEDD